MQLLQTTEGDIVVRVVDDAGIQGLVVDCFTTRQATADIVDCFID